MRTLPGMPTHPLAGQRALVTGATKGIGRAIAGALTRAGAQVGVVGRGVAEVEEVAEELGGWSLPGDVSDSADVARMLEEFQRVAEGVPDLLVLSAGVFSLAPVSELSMADFDHHLAVNLRGSVLFVQALLPRFLERGSGTIILIGSVAGRRGFPGNAAYSASKFGLRGVHEVLLEELRGTGVRSMLVEPSATDTSLWDPLDPDARADLPNRREMLRPEAVASAVVFLASLPREVQIPFLPIEASGPS